MLNSVSPKHFTFLPNHYNFISDTVTVCMLYHGEVRKWIPGEERVGLNGSGIQAFSSFTYKTNIKRSKVITILLKRCALSKCHVTDSQNTRDQITSHRGSKRARLNCVLCIPFIVSGKPNERWLHTCDACVITTWTLGLLASLVARILIPCLAQRRFIIMYYN